MNDDESHPTVSVKLSFTNGEKDRREIGEKDRRKIEENIEKKNIGLIN